jgi:selenophosphate synthetase-related protein
MPEVPIVKRYVSDILWIREALKGMDALRKPVMGIRSWDDAVIVRFGGKQLVVSVDGPYSKRLVMRSALIHASTDVVVKGARPLFALDAVIGGRGDVEDMIASLRRQAEFFRIPLLGGNTLLEEAEPRCTITVVGEMVLPKPIRDSTARKGDVIALMGESIWGELEERLLKAQVLFAAWYAAIKKVKINSAKDVTKGGISAVVDEMAQKSKKRFVVNPGLTFPLSRNLDNFLVTLPTREYEKLETICRKYRCPIAQIGCVE